jgi:hypothetical protein
MSSELKHLNLMYNQEEDRFYCLTDAPNKEAVENHHNKHGIKCEWISEVKRLLSYRERYLFNLILSFFLSLFIKLT